MPAANQVVNPAPKLGHLLNTDPDPGILPYSDRDLETDPDADPERDPDHDPDPDSDPGPLSGHHPHSDHH